MRLKVTNPALVQAIVLHLSLNGYKVDTNIQPKVRPDLIDREVDILIDPVDQRVSNWLSEPKGTMQAPLADTQKIAKEMGLSKDASMDDILFEIHAIRRQIADLRQLNRRNLD